MSEPFPRHGPDFNQWNGDLLRLTQLIAGAANEFWWSSDWPLKYLEIRVDTRDGTYVLFDRDRNRIDPERVEAAIKRHREEAK